MKGIRAKDEQIRADYLKDFPPAPSAIPEVVMLGVLPGPAAEGATSVRVGSSIANEAEYSAKLAEHRENCRRAEDASQHGA